MTKKNLQAAYIYMMAVTRQEAHVLPPLLAQPAGRPTPHSHLTASPWLPLGATAMEASASSSCCWLLSMPPPLLVLVRQGASPMSS